MTTKIRFIVSYDGTDFCGWQRQKHGPIKSVAHTIEEALEHVFREKITLFASGRTDAGVHALAQVCHFETQAPPERFQKWDLVWALNSHLPKTIRLKQAWIAPSEFHATISATHKTYKYYIFNSHRPSPFMARYADWIRSPIDINHLNESAKLILGHHDFASFQSVGTPVSTTDRTIFKAHWSYRRPHLLEFSVTGSGFLKQMVRNLVGTMVMLEKKGFSPSKMLEIIDAKARNQAGPPAPPEGLFLFKVYYPQELDNKCRKI